MNESARNRLMLDLYRAEIIENAKLRDNLYEENNRIILENDKLEQEVDHLTEELSNVLYENERLKRYIDSVKSRVGEDVLQALKKSPAATDDK